MHDNINALVRSRADDALKERSLDKLYPYVRIADIIRLQATGRDHGALHTVTTTLTSPGIMGPLETLSLATQRCLSSQCSP